MTGLGIGGGANGVVVTTGAKFNNTARSVLTAATCGFANGIDSTTGGLCSSTGTTQGVAGSTVTTNAQGGTAYGAYSRAENAGTTAIGFRSLATHDGSIAIGYQAQAQATADPATAVGANALASGNNSLALGAGATASGDSSSAVGAGATASAANSVALGANSVADQVNTVSVGTPGAERRITNVAPGVNPTDAVNVSQLAGVQQNVFNVARLAYTGIAGATALSMIPEVDTGKTFALGVGVGQYKGFSALAVGASARISEHIRVKAGLSFTDTAQSVGAGASYSW